MPSPEVHVAHGTLSGDVSSNPIPSGRRPSLVDPQTPGGGAWKNSGSPRNNGQRSSDVPGNGDRKNINEWRFPSVNFSYYHTRLSVLNTDDSPKYKTRRNSYDLIKDKCLAILNGKKRVRSVDDEAYQVSKIITIFDNVGHRKNSGGKDTARSKERKEKSEGKDSSERSSRSIGSPRAFCKASSCDEHTECHERKQRTNEDIAFGREHTKAVEEKVTSDTTKKLDTENRPSSQNRDYNSRGKIRYVTEIFEPQSVRSKATSTREDSRSIRCQDERKVQISTVQNSQQSQMIEEMERTLGDRKVQKDSRNKDISPGISRRDDEKLRKHTLKTEVTIEHRATNQGVNKTTQKSDISTKVGYNRRSHSDQKSLHTHQRNPPVAQTFGQSLPATSPLKANEKIVKMLDSSHFVITKERDKLEGNKNVLNVKTERILGDNSKQKVDSTNKTPELRNIKERVQYKAISKDNLEKQVVHNVKGTSTSCVEFETEQNLENIDNIRADGTSKQSPDRQYSLYEKIDEEIDIDSKETTEAINIRDSGIHLEDYVKDENYPESVSSLANQYRTDVNDQTSIEIHPKTLEEVRKNGSGLQELLASQLMAMQLLTDQERCQHLNKDQRQQHQQDYQNRQQISQQDNQYIPYDKSTQRSTKGIRPSSVSTITASKRSKSSIQEDMLDIWLDHQKFLQRHPEDDSFYSFLFVFFAVFASFVFVLILYFVMFVV